MATLRCSPATWRSTRHSAAEASCPRQQGEARCGNPQVPDQVPNLRHGGAWGQCPRLKVVADRKKPTLHGMIREYVLPESMIFTDEYYPYVGIERHFQGHKRIRHREGVYVEGEVHTHTIEGFFGLLKNGIRGVYHAVSREYLQSYLDEYAFRYNARNEERPMFWLILDRVRKEAPASS